MEELWRVHKGWHCSVTQQIGTSPYVRPQGLGISYSVLLAMGHRQGVRASSVM